MPLERFGALLFGGVYVELSAYVVLGRHAHVVAFKLFDTACPPENLMDGLNETGRIVLFSNHPTGNMHPTEDDVRNAKLVSACALYIVCEDECIAIGRP